jgi:H+/Cl- antiporter ClcA
LIVLERATELRLAHPWLLLLLPLGGLVIGALYHAFGRDVEGGNNLVIDEFHDPKKVIPLRMAPLVLLGTIVTHLFGGSAGREGTAVQMGASIGDQFTHVLKLDRSERRLLLMAGMSGGFGSVFGVPIAGTLFGIEVLAIGRLQLWAVIECAVSATAAHFTTTALGVHHTAYATPSFEPLSLKTALLFAVSGVAFGLAAKLFSFLAEGLSKKTKSLIKLLPLRVFIGGVLVSALFFLFPFLDRYAGLGVPLIEQAIAGKVFVYDWIGKLAMTALTLGFGFKGGEVTPLLFVGATLGNALSTVMPVSPSLLGAVGFVAVFAGAANTPLACIAMACEIFGFHVFFYAALACLVSYAVSGHRGIYHAQKVHIPKHQHLSRFKEILSELFKKPNLSSKQEKGGFE